MGASSSKSQTQSKPINMEFVLDEGVKKNIDLLNQHVTDFNSNNAKALMQVVRDFKTQFTDTEGKPFNFYKVDEFIEKFHQEMLKNIEQNNQGISKEDLEKELSKRLKDTKKLPEYLKEIYSGQGQLADLKKSIMEQEVVAKDENLKNNIDNILTNITGLKSKYRFFEYRYIQLNLFLIIFIQHTFVTMDNFINTVVGYTIYQDKQRSENLRALVDLLIKIMNEANLEIDQQSFDAIDGMMSVVEEEIKKKQVSLTKAIEKARTEAMEDLMKELVKGNDEMGGDAMSAFAQPPLSGDNVVPRQFSAPLMQRPRFGNEQQFTKLQTVPRRNTRFGPGLDLNDPVEDEGDFGKNPREQKFDMPGLGSLQTNGFRPDTNVNRRSPFSGGSKQKQAGGFVKDHSRFPQSFYELTQ